MMYIRSYSLLADSRTFTHMCTARLAPLAAALLGLGCGVGNPAPRQFGTNQPALSHSCFTTIDYPGALNTLAVGIGPNGEIVGAFDEATGRRHGFKLSEGTFTQLDVPGSTLTNATDINDEGTIVGRYNIVDPVRVRHGFQLNEGT